MYQLIRDLRITSRQNVTYIRTPFLHPTFREHSQTNRLLRVLACAAIIIL